MIVRYIKYILVLLLVFCPLALPGSAETVQQEAEYTLLIYMVGSDLESENGLASQDLQEMIGSYPDGRQVDVAVCAGGATLWHTDIGPAAPTVYRLTASGLQQAEVLPAQSMTEAQTLSAFLEYAFAHCPAQSTALVLWNHGGGPMVGFGIDETDDDSVMSCQTLQQALQNAPYQGENAFEWIGMDACLMGSLEVAALCRPFARYFIASEEVEMPCGWDYSFLSALGNGQSTPELAHIILTDFYDSTVAACGGNTKMMPSITLACYDLAAVEPFAQAFDALARRMDTSIDFGGFETFARSRAGMRAIGRFSAGLQTDLVDVGQLLSAMEKYYPQEAQTALAALDALVLETVTNNDRYCGLSLYFPYTDKAYYSSEGKQLYQELSFSDSYRLFLDAFTRIWLKETAEQSRPLEAELGDTIQLVLDDKLVKTFQEASFLILADGKSSGYIRVHESPLARPEGNILSYDPEPLVPCITDRQTGDWMYLLLEKAEETETQIHYQAPVLGMYFRMDAEDASDWKVDSQPMELQIVVDRALQDGMVIGAFASNEEAEQTYGKKQVELEQWTSLQSIASGRQPAYGRNGQLLPYDQWLKTGTIFGWELEVSDSFSIDMIPFERMTMDLAGQFVIRDVYGNCFASELIPLHQAAQDETAYGTIEKTWTNPAEPLLLVEHEALRLWIQSIQSTAGGDRIIAWTAENRTDKPLALRSQAAVTDREQRSLWVHETLEPNATQTFTSSLSKRYPYEKAVPAFSDIAFEIELEDEAYRAVTAPFLCRVSMEWPVEGEPSVPPKTDASPRFHMQPAIVAENDSIRIEATDYAYSAYGSEEYYFRVTNKTGQKMVIKGEEGYFNDWMIDSYLGSVTLLPYASTLMCMENENLHLLLPQGNVAGIQFSWGAADADRETLDMVEIPLVPNAYAPDARLPEMNCLPSEYGCISFADLFLRKNSLDQNEMVLAYTFENHSDRPVLITPVRIAVNQGPPLSLSLTPDYVYSGKKRSAEESFVNEESLLLLNGELRELAVCLQVYDAETKALLGQVEAAARYEP